MAARGAGAYGARRVLAYLIGLLVALALVLAALTWLYDPAPAAGGQRTEEPSQLEVGAPAPAFELRTLEGERVTLSSLRGSPVWLSFWSTECGPCGEQLPDLVTVGREARERGVTLLAVNVGEKPAAVRAYLRHAGYGGPSIALDPDYTVASAYGVYYMPAHAFVDSEGVVRRVEAKKLSGGEMREAVRDLR